MHRSSEAIMNKLIEARLALLITNEVVGADAQHFRATHVMHVISLIGIDL